MDHSFAPTPRRGFLARVAAAVAAAGALPLVPSEAATQAPQASDHDKWLDAVSGKHRQLFDMSALDNGLPLIHMLNYFGTYTSAYGAKPGDVNAIGTFYGMTTLLGVNDAMWTKYRLGAAINVNDHKTGAPATRNPWRTDPEIKIGQKAMVMPQASIEALQKLGTTFILCNNALTFFAGEVAAATNQQPAAVLTEFKANMLPGVVLVPAMVIAIQKVQDKGIAYNKQ